MSHPAQPLQSREQRTGHLLTYRMRYGSEKTHSRRRFHKHQNRPRAPHNVPSRGGQNGPPYARLCNPGFGVPGRGLHGPVLMLVHQQSTPVPACVSAQMWCHDLTEQLTICTITHQTLEPDCTHLQARPVWALRRHCPSLPQQH